MLKAIGSRVAAAVFKRPGPVVATSALRLAQMGEFPFVLEQNGRAVGLTPAGVGEAASQAFIASRVVRMNNSTAGRRIGDRREARAAERGDRPLVPPIPPVVVIGASDRVRHLIAEAVPAAGLDNPVVVSANPQERVTVDLDPALVVAVDLGGDDLDGAPSDATARCRSWRGGPMPATPTVPPGSRASR